jgi:hypothetical protein
MEGRITEQELLDALRQALTASPEYPDDARTTEELMDLTGYTYKRVIAMLKALRKRGECECIRVKRENIIGVLVPVPAWRVRKAV